jgi:hypothetical protein
MEKPPCLFGENQGYEVRSVLDDRCFQWKLQCRKKWVVFYAISYFPELGSFMGGNHFQGCFLGGTVPAIQTFTPFPHPCASLPQVAQIPRTGDVMC